MNINFDEKNLLHVIILLENCMDKKLFVIIFISLSVFVSMASPAGAQEYATYYRINIEANGSAVWIVENRMVLSSSAEVEAWNVTFSQEREGYLDSYRDSITESVQRAAQLIGREMSAGDFELEFRASPVSGTSAGDRWLGVIEYRFTWNGFAATSDGTVYVGDAFVDGFYLETESVLYISPPTGFQVVQVVPEADAYSEDTAVWFGDVDANAVLGMRVFDPGFPQVRMESDITPTTGQTDQDGQDGSTFLLLAGAAGLLAIAALVGAITLRRRRPKIVDLPEDRETLLNALRQFGGQAYQIDLVRATGFSEAKVSVLLKELHQEGIIIKVKRGNRNIIRLNEMV